MKALLCFWLVAVFSISSFGQGVTFANQPIGSQARLYDSNGVLLSGTNYVAQLYAGHSPDFLRSFDHPAFFHTGTNAGYFIGRTVVLTGFEACFGAWIQVRAWEAAGGKTFEEAAKAGAWTGSSTVINLPVLGGCGAGVPIPPVYLWGLEYPGHPIIVSNPQNTKYRAGESAQLSLVASGGITLYYQWYLGQSGDTNAPIAGATNAVYVTSPLTADASYWVRAQTAVGSVDSSTATVTVYPAEASVLELQRTDDALRFSVHAPQGAYILEESTNLAVGNWGGVTNLIISSSPLEFLTRADTNSSERFYRLRAE